MSTHISRKAALASALPCAACKELVIETRSVDGALVVLNARTKGLHLCVKRKEIEVAKAKQVAATRSERPQPRKPLPPAKRAEVSKPPERPQAERPHAGRPAKPMRGRDDRAARDNRAERQGRVERQGRAEQQGRVERPVRAKVSEPPRKAPPRRKPRKETLRSPQQVQEILKGNIVKWRTGTDSPTSFCAECATPVLVGFSHVRWDVMMVDAAGHRPHDCKTSRMAASALVRDRLAPPIDIPVVAAPVETTRRVVRRASPIVPVAPIVPSVTVAPKPRRRPAGSLTREGAANSCESCGKLTAVVNGERVCLHCGA